MISITQTLQDKGYRMAFSTQEKWRAPEMIFFGSVVLASHTTFPLKSFNLLCMATNKIFETFILLGFQKYVVLSVT